MGPIFGAMAGIGQAAANNLIGAGVGAQARYENYKYGEMAAENADKRTRALYNDFYSPQALLKQYQAAGLSPSLMFDGTPGQGGMSGAQGSGPSGVGPIFSPIEMAQFQNLMADAKLKNAEADRASGKGPMGEADLKKTLADAGQAEASEALTKQQTLFTQLQNYVKEGSKEYEIVQAAEMAKNYAHNATQAFWGAKNAKLQFDFNTQNFSNALEKARNETFQVAADILHKNAQINLTNKQIDKLMADIAQGWQALTYKGMEIANQWTAITNQKAQWDKEIKLTERSLDQQMEIFKKTNKREWTNTIIKPVTSIISGGAGALMLKGVVGKFMPGAGIPIGNSHLLQQMSMPYGAGGGYYGGIQ